MMCSNDFSKLSCYYYSVLVYTVSKRYPPCFKADEISSFMQIPIFLTLSKFFLMH